MGVWTRLCSPWTKVWIADLFQYPLKKGDSALVMGAASDAPVKVDDTAFIATSFPDFIPMMRGLGADLA